jgi:succinate dehydrogenase / fumarate reductase iron-sulfur subunit
MATMQFSVYRYYPEKGEKPHMQDYELDTKECTGVMLLDALEALHRKDSTLAFRRSCGEGVCGSDGMNINGRNGLACVTQLASLPEKVVLYPLPGFPVIRDLIVDLTEFYRQYERGKPYLQNDELPPAKERLQSPADRAKLDGLYECILCACCSSSCPSYWWNPEKFEGPAALLWEQRFAADTRDTKTDERLAQLQDAYSMYRCRSIMNCVDVCPKGLNPAKAIGELRRELVAKAA